MSNGVKFPFGKADVRTVPVATVMAETVSDQMTYLKVSGNLTAASALNITALGVEDGASLYVEVPCATAYDLTFGSTYVTIAAAGVTGTTNKTKVAHFVYASGKFVHVSTNTIN
jgi:hypothetical protein